jgi:hypothetical protein
MNKTPEVLIYGASGYTGKLVAEYLATRNIPFYFAGRTRARLEDALKVVEQRVGGPVPGVIVTANNTVEELLPLFKQVKVVINVAGPFMQVAWPVVEASLQAGCHYLDTTGEQDWVIAIAEKYGQAFADKKLLLCPANAYMWAAGALAAEVVLEDKGIDSLDILYQIDNGLPSQASTKSFLRMICNDTSQYFLEHGQYKSWPMDVAYDVHLPYRAAMTKALPWGGACEPVWFKDDARVRNCKVLTAIGEHLVGGIMGAIAAFKEHAQHLPKDQREAWTNGLGEQMMDHEPPKDDVDVQRSVIVCSGQGRQKTSQFVFSLSAPYSWTGDLCAEAAQRLLAGQLKAVGFQSAAKAFGHRELIAEFHQRGYCNLPA